MSDTSDPDLEKLRQVADLLIQYHDTVQILTTRHSGAQDDGTDGLVCGRGNTLARMGQVRKWLNNVGVEFIASDDEIARVNKAAKDLGQSFDTSQLFVGSCDGSDRMAFYAAGAGNLFARHEHARQWLVDMSHEAEQEDM